MRKAVFRVTGIILMCLFMMAESSAATTFSDVQSEAWFHDNVQVLVNKGIIKGYGDGEFKPDNAMTVDQFIKTMVVALGEDPGNGVAYWAQPYIDKAIAMGIVQADDFSEYEKVITRAQMSMLSVRTVESLEGTKTYKYDTGANDQLIASISDCNGLMNDERMFISQAYELGIITGYPDGSFKPEGGLKRSEACTVIRRVIDMAERKPYVADEGSGVVIEDFDGDDKIDFRVSIDVLEPLEEQYEAAEMFLNNKIGEELTVEIMTYVKQKTYYKDPLPEDYTGGDPWAFDGSAIFTGKQWDWNGQLLQVISGINNRYIEIESW